MPDEARPVPAAVASRIAWEFDKDVVIVLALTRGGEASHLTCYGKTPADARVAERLARIVRELSTLDGCEPEP